MTATADKTEVSPRVRERIPFQNRVAVFIDGQNFYKTIHECFPGEWINLQRFMAYLRKGHHLHSVHYYDAVWPDSEELQSRHDGQVRFLNALRRYGFKVWTKSVVEHYDAKSEQTVMKGNIDVELAVDAMTLCSAGRIDELILFSADGDFSYMLDRLHFLYGVITTVIGPNQKTSLDLRDKCDRFVPLEEVSSGFMEKKQFTNGLRQEAVGIQ